MMKWDFDIEKEIDKLSYSELKKCIVYGLTDALLSTKTITKKQSIALRTNCKDNNE